MSAPAFEKGKSEMGNMDELQFNASLDALLDGENLNDEGSASNPYPVMSESTNMRASMSRQSSQPMQGLLGNSGAIPLSIASYGGASTSHHAAYPGIGSYGSLGGQSQMYSQTQPAEYITSLDASSVVSSTPSGNSRTTGSRSRPKKRVRDPTAISEDEGDRGKRRQDRNQREQQRSQKITNQIDELKELLAAADVPFKPDKYSTLVSVADYIQELQDRSALLDVEHKKLVETISRTNELANEQYMPASTNGSDPPGSTNLDQVTTKEGMGEALFAPSIDYKTVFSRCGVPLAVLSIDGRFLECNQGFERLTGYPREELLPCEQSKADSVSSSDETPAPPPASRNMSLFNLLSREHMEAVFLAMSEILRQTPGTLVKDKREGKKGKDYWSGDVFLSRNMEVKVRGTSCQITGLFRWIDIDK
jgi:PAS domain-containing protein